MILQYYVTESTTGNRTNIEIEAATKEDLEITKMVGRLFGIPSSSLTRRKKSMSQKRKLVRSLHLVPTVLGREA